MPCYSGIPNVRNPLVARENALPGIYYHYTSLGTLWAVLDGETLRATQACFSNDSEEVKKGKHLIAQICQSNYRRDSCVENRLLMDYANSLVHDSAVDIDCYIVCFCGNDDKLSQWRAYCRNDGVSIGFAFDGTEPYYYFNDMPAGKQPERKALIYPVWYLDETTTIDKKIHHNVVSDEDISEQILKKISEIRRLADFQIEKAVLESTIPLIKHAGFYEEDEYRLLVCNTQSEQGGSSPFPLDPYIQIREDGGIQNPYINIRFAKKHPEPEESDPLKKKASPVSPVQKIRLYNISKKLKELIHKRFSMFTITEESIPNDTRSQIVIGIGDEKSQQTVFESVERAVAEVCKNAEKECVKIWCEGHLPIRSIRVSPCENQEQVIRSIRHYCTHKKYWLKYVDVVGSLIPYRRPK